MRKPLPAVVWALACGLSAAAAAQQPGAVQAKLLGTWDLVTVDAIRTDGTSFLPFGADVSGQLVYSDDGRMVAAWGSAVRPAARDASRPTGQEVAAFIQGFDAYWGTFTVAEERGEIVHHVVGALDPAAAGTDRVRTFELRDGKLILKISRRPCWWQMKNTCRADDEPIELRLTWQRR